MQDIKVHYLDCSHVQIECCDSIMAEMREYFSFEVDGARFQARFKYGGWDGRIRLMDYNGKLPIGLTGTVGIFARQMEYSIWVDPRINATEDITEADFNAWVDTLDIYSGNARIKPHWYQTKAAFEGIKHRRRILNMPTSSGKSLTQCIMSRWYLENYEGKVLIIVPTTSLVLQMRDDFVDYQLFPYEAIHCITSGKSKIVGDRLICVSTWQSACKQPLEWFKQFGCVMVDECHLATAKNLTKIVTDMTHCQFKFGLSGSLRDGKANLMQYVGMFGDISRPVTVEQLMQDGQVSNLKINCLFLRYSDEECAAIKGLDYQTEIKFITEHKKRNAFVCKLALKLGQKENVFVMFKSKKHGKRLYEALAKNHGNVYYVDGDVDTETRDALKKMSEITTGVIIVASYGVFSTGVSIKNLHHVIFGHPIKTSTIVRQTIGRALRKHASKSVATVWDIVDHLAVKTKSPKAKKQFSHLNYVLKHALERIKIFNEDRFEYSTKTINL